MSDTELDKKETEEMAETKKRRAGAGFAMIELISRLVLAVMTRFWKLCSTALLIILLVFWFEGGMLASFLLVMALLGLFYNAQDMLLYHPDQPPHSRMYVELPGILHLPYENHFVKTRDGTQINVVLVKQSHLDVPTVVFFHGNAGNIGHRLMNVLGLYSACKCNIAMVEYRGYGKSDGSPSEHGMYDDAEAALDFVLNRSDINKRKIFIFGRSLGGAVAINLVSKASYSNLVAGLIVENTFTSLPDIARVLFRFKILDYLPLWCFKNQYPSKKRLNKSCLPILFLSGLGDQLIPPPMMTELFESSSSPLKRISRFPGGSHNETWMSPGYYEAWHNFLKEVCDRPVHDSGHSIAVHMDKGVKDV
ncbi:protein ABHD13-like [Haliotis rubra]|uniref:protein ABHD13-like n=1 Tax=Haliotis rubra TaxID=36100 RepID=UPI001EE56DCF|nr:protein ABHD13-like [Haliotis rubra]